MRYITKLLERLFKNDWVLIDSYCGTWTDDYAICYFNIYYSERRSKYKVKEFGDGHKNHPIRHTAFLRLSQLNNKLINNKN